MVRTKKNSSKKAGMQGLSVPTDGAQQGSRKLATSKRVSVPKDFRVTHATVPKIMSRQDGSITVRHTEYLCDVKSINAVFSRQSFPLNPGMDITFPWLSRMGILFEFYTFKSLRFEYASSLGASTSGSVILATDFDGADPAYVNKQEMLMSAGAVRGPIWSPVLGIQCSADTLKRLSNRCTRACALAANSDIRTSDIGTFSIAVTGANVGSNCGELYVSYEVELRVPQPPSACPADDSAVFGSGGAVARNTPFGTAPTKLGTLNAEVSADKITFKEIGQYLLNATMTGTVLTSAIPAITVAPVAAATYKLIDDVVNNGATTGVGSVLLNILQPDTSIALDYTAKSNTLTNLFARLAPYNYIIG